MTEVEAKSFFLRDTIRRARALPMSDGIALLRGALLIAGDAEEVAELRHAVSDLQSGDDRLAVIAEKPVTR